VKAIASKGLTRNRICNKKEEEEEETLLILQGNKTGLRVGTRLLITAIILSHSKSSGRA
jgi:hypothetical protein